MAKAKTDWVSLANRPADTETAATPGESAATQAAPTPAPEPSASKQASKPVAEPVARPRPARMVKIPATYRLPEDCLDLLETAIDRAAATGKKLTREQAVADAIRHTYGTG